MDSTTAYKYDENYSIYGNLKALIEFCHGSRGFLSNTDTVRRLLWLIKEGTGINYVPENRVDEARTKAYSEGYAKGREETKEAYSEGTEEGKRQEKWLRQRAESKYGDLKRKHDKLEQELKEVEANIDTAYDKGYLKGCQEAEEKYATQQAAKRPITSFFPTEAAVTVIYDNGYRDGYRKGIEQGTKGKEKFANDRAEESYKKGHAQGIKDAWQKFDQGTTWEEGYQQGKRDADAKHQVLIAKAEKREYDSGFREGHSKGIKDSTQYIYGRDAGFADGYEKGKKQGKKEVVDFINNMKVSQ